jgi:CO/xanthine dehydrogenase Mo-binding subunit
MEMPERLGLRLLEDAPSPLNPLGVKGAGEGGCTGAGAALANAVADALAPLGARVSGLPLSPGAIVAMVRAARGDAGADAPRAGAGRRGTVPGDAP